CLLVYSYLVFKVQTSIREIALSKLNQTTEYVDQLTTESGSLTIPLSLNVDVQTFSLLYILRKEVIQPHLPIRLPCYDVTPIIGPTFGGWLPQALPHRLRLLPPLVLCLAVCTRLVDVFAAACWSSLTSDPCFTHARRRPQAILRP